MTHLIYLATNQINNKRYIGQTKTGRLARRIYEHETDAKYTYYTCIFHAAILKYGIENFTFEIIEDNISQDLINEKEEFYIKFYNTFYLDGQGYNMTWGGQGIHGYQHTEKTKKQVGLRSKLYWKNLKENDPEKFAEYCRQNSIRQKGKKTSDETRQKISIACKGRIPHNKNKKLTEEQKLVIQKKRRISANTQRVGQYNLKTGEFIAAFDSSYDAACFVVTLPDYADTLVNTVMGRIHKICKENLGHAYGFIWRPLDDYKEQTLSADLVARENRPAKAEKIVAMDKLNNVIAIYESAAAFARTQTNIYKEQRKIAKKINNCCINNKEYLGVFWKKLKDKDLEGNIKEIIENKEVMPNETSNDNS